MRKVWVYQKGDESKVFATNEIAQAWFRKNDPEGVGLDVVMVLELSEGLWR